VIVLPVTYKLIATTTVSTATAANIEFTSIPATFDDLVLKFSIRGSANTETGTGMRFNGSSATNYSWRTLAGNGAAASSGNASSQSEIFPGRMVPNDYTASTFANNEVYIPNYAGSTNKSVSVDSVTENNATTALMVMVAGLRAVTDAITSITIFPASGSIAQYSSASLYGIKKS
jgi:hypothetical protein